MTEAAVAEAPKKAGVQIPDEMPRKAPRKIHPTRFDPADTTRNVWSIVPEQGTVFEELLEPTYWAHVATRLRPTDRIEVSAEDGSYFAELMVRSSSAKAANVTLLRKVDFKDRVTEDQAGGFDVKWRGPHHKNAVVRLSDNVTVQHGFDAKEDAWRWLSANIKSMTS